VINFGQKKKKKKCRLISRRDQMAIHFGCWRQLLLKVGPTFVHKSLFIFCQAHLLCYGNFILDLPVLAGLKMFGSEKLKFQVLTALSRFGTSIHPLSASLENALSGKNKILKNVVVVEGYKKWFCVFHIFATRAMKN
jgi:hypothetical protein